MGLGAMAESCGVPYDVLAWTAEWYFRAETLEAANAAIVNYHHRLPMTQAFGTGTLSSSDGQRFPVRGKSLTARHLSRYFARGQGISAYTHASDQHSTFDTKVIVATAPESQYVLDGILGNQTDLPVTEHATDTQRPDPALQRVSERHRPFMGGASRQRPIRRAVRVKTVQRVPRPLSQAQVQALLAQLRSNRDRAIVLLMLQGGLRPGEVLGLHLEDIAYGRRRVVVRHRDDHPKGARSKSRYERVVDLHEPETLAMVSAYVMDERPADGDSPLVFLIGGRGKRRLEALSYDGLVKMFTRATTRAGIRTPWVTPHACRHTHATAMWEGGMRELTLQKRLGHASPESTRIYTRVSDPAVVADYNRALGSQDTNDYEQS